MNPTQACAPPSHSVCNAKAQMLAEYNVGLTLVLNCIDVFCSTQLFQQLPAEHAVQQYLEEEMNRLLQLAGTSFSALHAALPLDDLKCCATKTRGAVLVDVPQEEH